jgi:hypothetical protein
MEKEKNATDDALKDGIKQVEMRENRRISWLRKNER